MQRFLDECLRAISGFKGTEDIANDKFLESPFTSDCVKTKTISSAPSYGIESSVSTEYESEICLSASEKWLDTMDKHMPIIIKHSSSMVRAAAVTCFAGMTSSVFNSLPKDKQEIIISSIINAALNDEVPSVRSAACRAIGVIACFPQIYDRRDVLENFIHATEHNALDSLISVRVIASWALANICDSISHYMEALDAGRGSADSGKSWGFISLLFGCALRFARDNDKVKANAVRALGNLSRFIQFTSQPHGDPVDIMHCKIEHSGAKVYKDDMRENSNSFPYGSFDLLEQMVQAFMSCMKTGNVKVQWNVCHALSNLFMNKTLKLQDMDWAESVFRILVVLLRDSSNFKTRIQAAAAVAVPETINDYGKSYYDVVKAVQHVVENFKSDQISEPSNFKYWIALEKQLTSTMLHLLGLASACDDLALQDFLIKKGAFLEVWFEDLLSSVSDKVGTEQKKNMVMRTIQSLIKVFERSNQESFVHSFRSLEVSLVKGKGL